MEREKRGPPASAAPSPFTAAIRSSPLPRVFRHNPDLLFNGEADPAEYLIQFNTEMEVYQVPEMTRCRLFAASLRGSAQQWFSKLGPASIRTWRQLEDLFVRQFQSTLHYSPPVATLANIKQREGEPLAEYFRRFNAEVPKSLQASEPRTLAEFYEQAEPFKRVEKSMRELKISESYRDKRDRSSSPDERRKTYRRSSSPKKSARGKEATKDSGSPYTSKWQTHTPLVASVDHIYATYVGKGVFRKATPLTDYNKRDTSKYCAYHEATGHDTADCRQLKDEIETLIRQGKLTEWVVKEVRRHRTDYHTVPPPPPEDKERVPRAGSIHIILGGSHIGGDSRKAMDRYAREAKDKPLTNVNHLSQRPPELFEREADDIVFKENDAKWVHYPHTDALVIKMKIGTRINLNRWAPVRVHGKLDRSERDNSAPGDHRRGASCGHLDRYVYSCRPALCLQCYSGQTSYEGDEDGDLDPSYDDKIPNPHGGRHLEELSIRIQGLLQPGTQGGRVKKCLKGDS
ncbi:uncharacterized protein LOC141703295 [Apium graveolens]|uniref:uncharacterized protein LOC141703295 n=1 Tax=Apium graveolens TaxID=4045 RepID=UPI003D7B219C